MMILERTGYFREAIQFQVILEVAFGNSKGLEFKLSSINDFSGCTIL